jgi:hypothetical protein
LMRKRAELLARLLPFLRAYNGTGVGKWALLW